jgi:hypothetical protein
MMAVKKAQVTAFVIIGIILIIITALFGLPRGTENRVSIKEMSDIRDNVDTYTRDCVSGTLEKGLRKYGLRAPELANFLDKHLLECIDDFALFRSMGFGFRYNNPASRVEIDERQIDAQVIFEVEISKKDNKAKLERFMHRTVVPADFKDPLEGYDKLFCAIYYKEESMQHPRPNNLYYAKIDLDMDCIEFFVTPGPQPLMVTSEFMALYKVQLAINGGGGNPSGPTNAEVSGFAKSNNVVYSHEDIKPAYGATLCASGNKARMDGICNYEHAVTGMNDIVASGKVWDRYYNPPPEDFETYRISVRARTSIGIDENLNWLNIIMVDEASGSQGLTLLELAEMHVAFGSTIAASFDGGGSTTLVIEENGIPVVKNEPSDPPERSVLNHLGVYAR